MWVLYIFTIWWIFGPHFDIFLIAIFKNNKKHFIKLIDYLNFYFKTAKQLHLNNAFQKWTNGDIFILAILGYVSTLFKTLSFHCTHTYTSIKSFHPKYTVRVLHKEWNKFFICFDKLFHENALNLLLFPYPEWIFFSIVKLFKLIKWNYRVKWEICKPMPLPDQLCQIKTHSLEQKILCVVFRLFNNITFFFLV